MPATNPFSPVVIYRNSYDALPSDWEAVTREHEYEDGTKAFNELADNAPKRWELRYTGLTTAEKDVFKAHFEEKRFSRVFDFVDKDAVTHPDTYYEKFEIRHPEHKSWDGHWSVFITLVEYSSASVASTAYYLTQDGTGYIVQGTDRIYQQL